MHYINK
jgi:hypothetical protein